MRNDQIFVLLLVILLPMSGCFDGAVGDAEAEEEAEGTNVVNNYYNNTTIMNAPSTEMFSVSRMVDENTTTGCESDGSDWCYEPFQFTTNSSELVEVIEFSVSNNAQWLQLHTDCGNGFTKTTSQNSIITSAFEHLPFSSMDCEHTVRIGFTYSNEQAATGLYFSLVYQIHEVTVL